MGKSSLSLQGEMFSQITVFIQDVVLLQSVRGFPQMLGSEFLGLL